MNDTMIATAVAALVAGTAESATWNADVDSLLSWIPELHPHPTRLHTTAEFAAAGDVLRQRLPDLSPHAAALEIQRILAMVGDGHTEWARMPDVLRGHWLPLIIRPFEEGWFVRTGDPHYRAVFGRPITHVAGVPIDDAVRRLLPYVAGENTVGKLDDVGSLLRNAKVLDAIGITDGVADRLALTVLESDGTPTTVDIIVGDDAWVTPTWRDVDKLLSPGTPESLSRRLDGDYACALLPDSRTLYVLIGALRDDDELDQTLTEFIDDVFARVRRERPEKLILDLRDNGGGNNYFVPDIVRGVIASPAIDRPGRLFVLIGPDTYSAAMNLAVALERQTNAVFVGEPTGATPNHWGDTERRTLPISGIEIEISTLFWQCSDPRDTRPWITPDIAAPISMADFIAGRDRAIEVVRGVSPSDTPLPAPRFAGRWQRTGQMFAEPPLDQLLPSVGLDGGSKAKAACTP